MLITAATSQEQDRLLHAVGHSAEEEKRSIKGEFDRSSPTWTIPNSTGPRPRDAAPPTLVQKKLEFLVAQHSHPAAAQTEEQHQFVNNHYTSPLRKKKLDKRNHRRCGQYR